MFKKTCFKGNAQLAKSLEQSICQKSKRAIKCEILLQFYFRLKKNVN